MKDAEFRIPDIVPGKEPTVAERELIPFFNLSIDLLCIVDRDGFFRRINPAFEKVLGYRRDELLTSPISEFLHPDDSEKTEKFFRKAFLGSPSMNFENRFKCTDGSYKWMSWNAIPIRETNVLYAVIREVTQEKEVDRMKTEFISLASHQLRTPLSAMKWFTEMLLAGDAGTLTKEQTEMLKNIEASTERMIAMVNALLDISRIESGRLIVEPAPTSVERLLKEVIQELGIKLKEKAQKIIVDIPVQIPDIYVDPKLLRHVYTNLLSNAVKYSPDQAEIRVALTIVGTDVQVEVKDQGYGIPKAEQGKLFQKFFRASNVIKVVTDGTGLGLYLVKSIVEALGGRIWYESEEGKGTIFWFTLPLAGSQPKKGEVHLSS